MPPGTWITVRVNEPLSSDHNRAGDTFTATLAQPLVAQGFVVARRGQTIVGRVAEADRGGKVKGTSRLGIELGELSLVDGQQVNLRTELLRYEAGTSKGRDTAAIGMATGMGAAIGAAADGGFGAGIGAAAGALASTIGVLATNGKQTVIYPEDTLTFRTQTPLTVVTDRSPQAFVSVNQGDYEPSVSARTKLQTRPAPGVYRPSPWGRGYPWGYPGYWGGFYGGYYGRFYGPSVIIRTGPGYYGRSYGHYGRH